MLKAIDGIYKPTTSAQFPGYTIFMATGTGKSKIAWATDHARVWHYRWNGDETEKVQDEPIGVITRRPVPELWVRVGWKWLTWGTSAYKKDFIILEQISLPEYETDLAFNLFKKLRSTHRPIRTWMKKHGKRIRQWNMVATCATVTGCLGFVGASNHNTDIWFIVGTLMGLHACASMVWLAFDISKLEQSK